MGINNERIKKIVILLSSFLCTMLVKRMLCAILLAFDVAPERIQQELGLSYKSVKKYETMLDSGEYEKLLDTGRRRRKSELEDHKEAIFKGLDSGAYRTLREIAVMIEEKTGLKRSRNRIQIFLRNNGYKPLKVGFFPCESGWGKAADILS